ncbi:NAD(P)/FAD-dependent oxidoreductase [Cupriavidus sp. WS]|uniref:flavin-containing monooxygenase n=1 Tax=Cupriavidus sp. WS TaxID=1312922 RepID=UPI000380A651|nr:NAD(P)/FAD-dependent oxidoreductase [Cupriavidus sp. WS]
MFTDTLIVGAGQAGIAMSEHLTKLDVPHVVLERDRIAERWRTGRWDSLVANGPAWHDRFPGLAFEGLDPDAFAPKDTVARYFETYARKIDAPVRTGVEVLSARRNRGRYGFTVETSAGTYEAQRIVVATGPFQRPVIPALAQGDATVMQIHSAAYRNPGQLPEGGVLVVGAGSSGVQIADELQRAGRKVYLSIGPHDRPPRSYRGRDFCWWLGVLGQWDQEIAQPGREHVTIAVSGTHGGRTIDFRALAHQGITLVGVTKALRDGVVTFENDLAGHVARGDASYLSLLDAADAYVASNGLDLPEEPQARGSLPDPACMTDPVLRLDLAQAGVASIIWATGYATDYGWLKADAFDADGKPRHQRGISSEPGVYFLGLPWLTRRASAFIWGVWHDARHIADHIVTQRKYLSYRADAQRRP